METLEQLKERSEKGKENLLPEVQAIIDSGRVTQWKKNPTIYFLKGYRKVALELNENGEFEESKNTKPRRKRKKQLFVNYLKRLYQLIFEGERKRSFLSSRIQRK